MARIIRQRTIVDAPPEGAGIALLRPGDDPAALVPRFGSLSVIAVEFPQFTDGRGYSMARLLRERHGWRGELRAVGDVQRDQLYYLWRCGFDAFVLKDASKLEEALASLGDFSEGYQATVERPLPLFRRRLRAA
jgi:uncharacterized protein (DUF934 family)